MSYKESKILEQVKKGKEVFWLNPNLKETAVANEKVSYSMKDIEEVEDRFLRFAPFIEEAFPETAAAGGILESELSTINDMRSHLEEIYDTALPGSLYLKRDDLLPISGTIKSRGAIYEVLKHAESVALEAGLLKDINEDYRQFASKEFQEFFSQHHLAVGTTGNLGISVGAMGRALGFEVTVHVSVDAKKWKKDYLTSRGVRVIEHTTDFTKAVEAGREASKNNAKTYFVDDEHSIELFLGYTPGGYRLKKQLANQGTIVDENHPLFVYLPCGIGGSPSGITFGLKQAFGDHVHCFFVEPVKMPSLLIGLETELFDKISVTDLGLGEKTVADGLAVPRTSGIVAEMMENYFSGGYTLMDDNFRVLLTQLYEQEDIFLEPAAVAGLPGPFKLLSSAAGQMYLKKQQLANKLDAATHIVWATGGSMVPQADRISFIEQGKNKSIISE